MTADLRDGCPRYAGRGVCLYDAGKPCACRAIEETVSKAFEAAGVAINMRIEADAALVRGMAKSLVKGVVRAVIRSALGGTRTSGAPPSTSA